MIMEIHVKPNQTDDDYWEFYLWDGDDKPLVYLWTVHQDVLRTFNDDFWKETQRSIEKHGYEVAVLQTDQQLMDYVDEAIHERY